LPAPRSRVARTRSCSSIRMPETMRPSVSASTAIRSRKPTGPWKRSNTVVPTVKRRRWNWRLRLPTMHC
jgi:hypothetical protein